MLRTLFSATILAGALAGSAMAQAPDAGCALPSEPKGIPAAFDAAISGPADKDRACMKALLIPEARMMLELASRRTISQNERKSDLLANTRDNRRNCRHIHMLDSERILGSAWRSGASRTCRMVLLEYCRALLRADARASGKGLSHCSPALLPTLVLRKPPLRVADALHRRGCAANRVVVRRACGVYSC
jgi:hypothetical protein